MKKLLSFMLAFLLLAGLCVPALASGEAEEDAPPAEAEVITEEPAIEEDLMEEPVIEAEEAPALDGREPSEWCGDNLKWKLTWDGEFATLTIFGTGDIFDFDGKDHRPENAPWKEYESDIIEVVLENGVTGIGFGAFSHCTNLKKVTFPDDGGFTHINSNAFWICESLKSIELPEGVQRIEFRAFVGCENLTEITIPSTITYIDELAFVGCNNLDRINYRGTQEQWENVEIRTTDLDSDFDHAWIHFEGAQPLSGGVIIDGTVVYHGDTVSCSLTGYAAVINASRIHYQWQTSPDKTNWTGVSGAVGASWETPPGGSSVSYVRVIVTADGYTGELVSDPCALNVNSSTASVIEGSVTIRQTSEDETSFVPGKEIEGIYRNKAGVVSTAPSLRYQWQRSTNNANWEDIPGATGSAYTPTDADEDHWLRLVVTSKYSVGELYSDTRQVVLPTYGGSIILKDLTMPVAGAEAKADAKTDGSGYIISEQGWYANVAASRILTSFEAGEVCFYFCRLQPTDGAEFERDGKYAGTITLNGEIIEYKKPDILTEELQNGEFPIKGYYFTSSTGIVVVYVDKLPDAPPTPAGDPAVTLSADATSAQAENFTGLYARVALVIDINGVSGLFVTQPTINDDGTIVIPSITMPGLTVKGVSVALVPTLADIQKSMPDAKASDMKMLG